MADSGGHIMSIFWLVVFLVMQVYGDGCTTYSVLSGQIRRSSAYNVTPDTAICDKFLTEQWYRIDSLAGNEIVRTCPAMTQCGTLFPLWMDGDLPIPSEGVVNRTVCKSGLVSCCEETLKIKVKNCGTYYVYLLKPASECSSAYCFGTLFVSGNSSSAATIGNSTASQTSTIIHTLVTSQETAVTNSEGDTTASTMPSITPGERKHKRQIKQEEDDVLLIIIVILILIICGLAVIIAVWVVKSYTCRDSNRIQNKDIEKTQKVPQQIIEPSSDEQPKPPPYKKSSRIKPSNKRIRP